MYFITYTLLLAFGFGYVGAAFPTPSTRKASLQIRALPDINIEIRDPEAIDGTACVAGDCVSHSSSSTSDTVTGTID